MRYTKLIILCMAFLLSSFANAQDEQFPIIDNDYIQRVADYCKIDIKITQTGSFDEELEKFADAQTNIIAIDRKNSDENINCFLKRLPNSLITMTGRSIGIEAITNEDIEAIKERCGWTEKDGDIILEADETIRFRPDIDAGYEKVDCALSNIRLYGPELGFVGNEQIRQDEK